MIRIFKITLYTKHKKNFKNFYGFLIYKIFKLNINILKTTVLKRNTIKKISILKSPHAHKRSQEQFEIRTYTKEIIIYATKSFKFLTLIKTLKNNLFYNVKIKIKLFTNKILDKHHKKIKSDLFKMNKNILFNTLKLNKKIKNKKIQNENVKRFSGTKKLLTFLEFKGELLK